MFFIIKEDQQNQSNHKFSMNHFIYFWMLLTPLKTCVGLDRWKYITSNIWIIYYFYWERVRESPHRNYLLHPLWHFLKGKCGKFAQEIIALWKFYSPDNFWGRQPCFEVNKYLTEITFSSEYIWTNKFEEDTNDW